MKQIGAKNGFGILEVVVAVALISLVLFGLMGAARLSQEVVKKNVRTQQAAFLLEEAMEAVRYLRDSSWSANIAPLDSGQNYFLNFTGSGWQVVSSNVFIDGLFERKFVLEDVYRDGNDDISVSGTLDPNTKKASVFVAWTGRAGTTTESISTYITNLFEN